MKLDFTCSTTCICVLLVQSAHTISVQEVQLNNTLIHGKFALPDQRVTFTCETKGTEVMEWFSEDYIGTGGDFIEIVSGGDGRNQTRQRGMTVATRIRVHDDNGITVIVSQLHIIASEQFPMSSVTCRINSHGPNETISFNITDIRTLQEVQLKSTLIQGMYVLSGQGITFTCETRGADVMEWFSEDYIGTGGDFIEIVSSGDGRNQTRQRGMTVATRIRVHDDNGITVIVSQLHIIASEQFPMSSVTCRINSHGPNETINFIITKSIPATYTTDSEVTILVPNVTTVVEASEGRSGNSTGLIAVSVVFVVIMVVIMVVIIFTMFIGQKRQRRQIKDKYETVGMCAQADNEEPDTDKNKKSNKESLGLPSASDSHNSGSYSDIQNSRLAHELSSLPVPKSDLENESDEEMPFQRLKEAHGEDTTSGVESLGLPSASDLHNSGSNSDIQNSRLAHELSSLPVPKSDLENLGSKPPTKSKRPRSRLPSNSANLENGDDSSDASDTEADSSSMRDRPYRRSTSRNQLEPGKQNKSPRRAPTYRPPSSIDDEDTAPASESEFSSCN